MQDAIRRKVAGSIPDGVIAIFHSHNPSDRSMALGSTPSLTELSTRGISRWVNLSEPGADNLTNFTYRVSRNLEASTVWNLQGLSWDCYTFYIVYLHYIT